MLLCWMVGVGYLLPMNQRDQSTVVEVDGKSLRLTWVKTSGASGLHLLVGIEPEYEFEEVHTWGIAIDRVLVERRPDLFSMDYTKVEAKIYAEVCRNVKW